MLRNLARTAVLAVATGLALIVGTPAEAAGKHLTILASVPDLAFPFFVYMMGQIKDEANRLGDITVVESDGQRSSRNRAPTWKLRSPRALMALSSIRMTSMHWRRPCRRP